MLAINLMYTVSPLISVPGKMCNFHYC